VHGLNQFFLFRKFTDLPSLFSDIGVEYGIKRLDKTVIEYASQQYGREVVFILPLSMIDCSSFIREIYPYTVPIGVLDDLMHLRQDDLKNLADHDFVIMTSNDIGELIKCREKLKKLSTVFEGKKILAYAPSEPRRDDILLFLSLADIYDYTPVLVLDENTDPKPLLGPPYDLEQYCTTKWFNYTVKVYGGSRSLVVLSKSRRRDIEVIAFRDCISLLCHRHGEASPQQIVEYILDNAKPAVRIGGVVIDQELLDLAETIEEQGSIRAASKATGLSYTRVRRTLKSLEKLEKTLGVQIIVSTRGGSEHGKTAYTHIGRIILDNLREIISSLNKAYAETVAKQKKTLKGREKKKYCIFPLSI